MVKMNMLHLKSVSHSEKHTGELHLHSSDGPKRDEVNASVAL